MITARSVVISRLRLYAPIACICAVACALSVSTYSTFGHTWDEPEHLAAGIALVDTGEYPYDQQHPPLARVAMAVGPYLAGAHSHGNAGPSGEEEGRDILYDEGRYGLYLNLARIGMLPFLIALLVGTWAWARRLYGEKEAILAAGLVATTPVIIGHAAVAALDVPMAGTTLVALFMLSSWMRSPSLPGAVGFGFAAGIAAGTKLSSIPFIGCIALAWFAIAWIVEGRGSPSTGAKVYGGNPFSRAAFLQMLASFGAAALALYACYGFNFEHVVHSFKALLEHNREGHLSYFMGELRRTGWWNFYLVGIAVKTPLPLLLAGTLGSVWLLYRAIRFGTWLPATPAIAWLVALWFASAYSQINIGIRHLLLVMPLFAIVTAATFVALWKQTSSNAVRAPIIGLLFWQAASMAAAHPDYLPYFNALAGSHPERLLIDSDLDWGQDLRRLKQTLREREIQHFSFVFRGTADLQREGFPSYEFLRPHKRATGWVAVSLLAKATGSEDRGYDWLNAYQPVMRVGKSIDLYYIEKSQ